MLCSEIIAVCSEIHTEHINTLCGQNVEFLNVKLAVHIVTTGLNVVNMSSQHKPHVTQTVTYFCYPIPHCTICLPRSQTLKTRTLVRRCGEFVKRRKCFCLHSMKVYGGGRGIAPLIHLDTNWWTFTFTRRPLCPQDGRLRNRISISDSSKSCFSSPKRRHQLWAHQPTQWSPGASLLEIKWRKRKTNHSCGIVPGLRMPGAVPPLSHNVRDRTLTGLL